MDSLRNCEPALRRTWMALCRSDEATETPRAHRLLGEEWVVWRRASGGLRVFANQCPHRLAPLTTGWCEGDSLRCGYHGWLFDSDGQCVEIPALGDGAIVPPRARLRAPAGVHESHHMIYVALETPWEAPPEVALARDATFMRGDLTVMRARASAGLLADNFLDVAHFPFVHRGTFGAESEREVPAYHVTREGDGFSAVYEHDFANREDPGVASGERPLIQRRRLTYRYRAPYHLELDIEFLDAGGRNVIGFFLVPEDNEWVRIYSSLWRNDLGGSLERMAEAVDFEVAVIDEDLALQAQYRTFTMPLDVTQEVHTRADRITVELRRILADIVNRVS